MDIRKKISRQPAAAAYRNRVVECTLLATLMLFAPVWVAADATLTPPMDMTGPDSPVKDNGIAPQDMATAPQGMRFITLGRVTFATNTWELSDTTKRLLDNIGAYLVAHPGAERLLLDGHTDWIGGMKFNDTLSDKRAMAVHNYLVSTGVDPNLIHWKGHGKHAPVDENWTRLGRIRNRQVELFAVYLPQQ
jgi:outer membrane protein OmpA-like peptidoglycan-associated protein